MVVPPVDWKIATRREHGACAGNLGPDISTRGIDGAGHTGSQGTQDDTGTGTGERHRGGARPVPTTNRNSDGDAGAGHRMRQRSDAARSTKRGAAARIHDESIAGRGPGAAVPATVGGEFAAGYRRGCAWLGVRGIGEQRIGGVVGNRSAVRTRPERAGVYIRDIARMRDRVWPGAAAECSARVVRLRAAHGERADAANQAERVDRKSNRGSADGAVPHLVGGCGATGAVVAKL